MSDDCVKSYELEWVQEQIWTLEDTIRDLEKKIDDLRMENTLLQNDLNTIKTEGCWRFVENPNHSHKPAGAADYEADKRNINWGSYEEDKKRGLVD